MKIIDLLNKIANGEEVPKKIQVYSDIFVFDNSNNVYEHEETKTNLLSIYNGYILNYELRIIEEEKKIPEKLTQFEAPFLKGDKPDIRFSLIIDQINEIIDYLEENK